MTRTTTAIVALTTTALALTACGGGGGGSSTAAGGGQDLTPSQSEECTEDKVGGTITMGEYVLLPTFMPGQGQSGVRGGAESAAVYDRLMRWNPESDEFEPKLAEALESDEDNSVWTLTLPEDVNFSNGDPLTAEDVAFTVGLHQDPATTSMAMTQAQMIDRVRVVDPQTVEFTLTQPWAGFPSVLAGTVGEVIPEAAYEASTPEEWASNPIGAGAFTLAEYTPHQKVVLEPNPDYYGGVVCPTLEFIRIPGSQGTLDAFETGEIQAGFLRGSEFINDARNAGVQGLHRVISAGSIINMNSGAAGYDGILTDERARRAVGHALDRELMDQRLRNGTGQPTSALLAESSRFYDGEQGPEYDPERASALVAELKEETDWDGSLTLLIADGPENVEAGVVTKALLDAAGFDVTIENAPVSQVTARQFTGDYEIVIGGLDTSDADPASAFYSALIPGGATNLTGIDNPELVEAVTELMAASDPDARKEGFAHLQEVHNRVLPFTVVGNSEEYVAIAEEVKGVQPTISSTVLFDNAFVEE